MIIFLDLDGVIINFAKGVFDWFGKPYEPEKVTSWDALPGLVDVDPKYFWDIIRTPVFWEYLEFYQDANYLINKLQTYGQVILLSSPSNGCAGYRQNWIQNNLPEFFKSKRYILTPLKEACAHSEAILIDDHDQNCAKFILCGGYSIIYPQPWNTPTKSKINLSSEKEKNNYVINKLKIHCSAEKQSYPLSSWD